MSKPIRNVLHPIVRKLAAGIMVTLFLSGCSTPASLPPKVAAGLKDLHMEGVSVKGQIEKTVGALKNLISNPKEDIKPQFQQFSQEFEALEAKVEKAVEQRAKTETTVEKQFLAWEENLKKLRDEELRGRAAERRAATEATYSEIQQNLTALKKVGGPFMADLTDTRRYLNDDLTKEGIEIIRPTAERVFDRKSTVIEHLDTTLETLHKAIERN